MLLYRKMRELGRYFSLSIVNFSMTNRCVRENQSLNETDPTDASVSPLALRIRSSSFQPRLCNSCNLWVRRRRAMDTSSPFAEMRRPNKSCLSSSLPLFTSLSPILSALLLLPFPSCISPTSFPSLPPPPFPPFPLGVFRPLAVLFRPH